MSVHVHATAADPRAASGSISHTPYPGSSIMKGQLTCSKLSAHFGDAAADGKRIVQSHSKGVNT